VPIDGDFTPGTDPSPLLVHLPRGTTAFGVLICYEDIFPRLARESVLRAPIVLAVLTNDAWYGRAAPPTSTPPIRSCAPSRPAGPVLRCGNGGWSGWIDEFGMVRAELGDGTPGGSFRGAEALEVKRDSRWVDRQSFYVQHGDWFVLVAALLALLGAATVAAGRVAPPPPR
jgi:apolipoprotein N-acyltransferase